MRRRRADVRPRLNVHFALIERARIDVGMIAPKGPGHRRYEICAAAACLPARHPAGQAAMSMISSFYGARSAAAAPASSSDLKGGVRDRPVRRADSACGGLVE